MSDQAKYKSEFLGMNFSTANSRLNRQIIFSLLKETGKDICFRCNQKINSFDDMSIDHMEPWLGVDEDLFWNMDNIAFSHNLCNSLNIRINTERRKARTERRRGLPEGKSWCCGHQNYLPVAMFSKNKSVWNDLETECKECRSKRRKK